MPYVAARTVVPSRLPNNRSPCTQRR
jgi:hypothetical protein